MALNFFPPRQKQQAQQHQSPIQQQDFKAKFVAPSFCIMFDDKTEQRGPNGQKGNVLVLDSPFAKQTKAIKAQ